MTEAIYPQCRIVPSRLLYPATTERLLNKICTIGGIRRLVLNGPRLPAVIDSGPGRGIANPHQSRKVIEVGGQEFELQVQVGAVLLELEDRSSIPAIKEACDEIFTEFPYTMQEGRFIKSRMSLSDYVKYGPEPDEKILGMADPRKKGCPIIIQGTK
jgi:methyl-coenzyme M reductase subunit D